MLRQKRAHFLFRKRPLPHFVRRTARFVTPVALTFAMAEMPAQTQQPVAAGQPVAAADASALTGAPDPNGAASELLFGRNQKGPYLLAWKGIRPGSEVVVRDGARLRRDTDYTFSPEAGTLLFVMPLGANQIVRISYRIDTPDAVRSSGLQLAPFQMDVLKNGQNRITWHTMFKPAQQGAGITEMSALSALQYNGGFSLSRQASVSSQFLLDLRGGDWLDRSGIQLSEKTGLRNAALSFGYARAGSQFAYQPLSGLTAGRETWEATGLFTPLRGLALNSFYRQSTELLDTSKLAPGADSTGTTTREIGADLALQLAKNGKVAAGRVQTETVGADGKATTQVADILKVEGALNKKTQATVGFESQTVTPQDPNAGAASYAQRTSVGVTARPIGSVLLTGNYQNALGTGGVQDIANLRFEATPIAKWRNLRLRGGFENRYAADGARRTRDAILDLPTLAFAQMKLSGGMRQSSLPGQERTTGLIDASLRPSRYVEVSGGIRLRSGMANNAQDPTARDTYDVKVAVSPMKRLRLTGSMTQNPGMDETIRQANLRAFGLETDIGSATFRGKYGIEDEYTQERLTNLMEFALDLRLTRWNSLTAGYTERSLYGGDFAGSSSYSLQFKHDFGSIFNLSLGGTYTLFGSNGQVQSDKTELRGDAKLGIKF